MLAGLLPWVLERIEQPLTVRDLARQAGMSSRNLARHFNAVTGMSPLRWLLTQRVRRAQELLETSDLSVEQVTTRAGMGTSTTLRRHFSQQVGVPPETYRSQWRGETAGHAARRADARQVGAGRSRFRPV